MTTAADGAGDNKAGENENNQQDDKAKDILAMSDEDFLKMNAPGAEPAPAAAADGEQSTTKTKEGEEAKSAEGASATDSKTAADDADKGKTQDKKEEKKEPDASAAADGKAADKSGAAPAGSDDKTAKPAGKVEEKDAGAKDPKEAAKAAVADPKGKDSAKPADGKAADASPGSTPVDFEAFYKQVMAPFKANGRTIELKSPDEVIRLMQQGAGYGRKIQDMQPHLKTIRMLEKANLLDEGKLSFLIDINNKNVDAIKKLIKDAGIDPLDLNIGDNASYTPTNAHVVSDQEVNFQSTLKELQANPEGLKTLQEINQTWDQQSKAAPWDSPELMNVIHTQRENGVYDQIASEVERQKLLGKIPPSTPFLQAYKLAGDHLVATNGFKAPAAGTTSSQQQSGVTPQGQVLEVRTEAPKATVANDDKAAAAAPTKQAGSKGAKTNVNVLNMPDDEFLKQFAGRL